MKTYIVFGMHRSGTSFLAHALKDQGVNMGQHLLGSGRGNPGGHFENMDFLILNNDLLSEANGSWANLPSEDKIIELGQKHKERIKDLIDKNKDNYWGFKDCRTSITIKAYLSSILEVDDDPFLYLCFRRPNKVADSLHRRDGILMEKGRELAIEYNRRIINFLKDFLETEK